MPDEPEDLSAEDAELMRLVLRGLRAELDPTDAARLDALASASPERALEVERWVHAWILAGLIDPTSC